MPPLAMRLVGCVLLLAAAARADEPATWTVTLDEGLTNNAPVTLSDGNYTLRGWIRDAAKKHLAVGGHPDPDHVGEGSEAHIAAGQALVKDAAGAYIGAGDLDLRGAVVTADAADAAEAWTIVRIGRHAFNGVSRAPFNTCILPETLLSMDDATFASCGSVSGFTTFRLVAPEMTGTLPNNTFLGNTHLTKVLLQIPKVDAVYCYWNRNAFDNFLAETDVSDWDLSSVQSFYRKREDEGYLFRWSKFHGTMRVPALKWLNARTFESCPNMAALEAGRNGTLEYVGYSAVTNCPALGSVVLGGAAAGWTISSNAFNAVNLTNVTFLTTPPAYEEAETVVFGTAETPARQIAFHIPPRGTRGWDANWSRFARAARAPADAERAAFAARFGAFAAEGLVGLVPPALFRTAREQWLVCGRSPVLRHAVRAAVFDPRFDGDAVEVSPAPDADGRYAAGTRVTLTARPNAAKGRFVRWRGTVPEARENEASLTLVLDRDLDLTAQFAHDWTFTPADPEAAWTNQAVGYISNQVWKIRVQVLSAADRTLRYGTEADNQGSAWTDFGEGMLDLNGSIFDEAGERWTMTGYNGWQGFQGPVVTVPAVDEEGNPIYGPDGKTQLSDNKVVIPPARYPRALVLREDLPVSPGQSFRYITGSGTAHNVATVPSVYGWNPTNLVFECAALTANLSTDAFAGYQLSAGRLRLPGLARAPQGGLVLEAGVDVSDWRLDAVTNIVGVETTPWGSNYGLFSSASGVNAFRGTLRLPSLAVVQANGCWNARGLEAVELGSNTVVTSIGTKAFKGCSSLARIQLRAGRDLAVGEDAFEGTAALKVLAFTFEAPQDPTAVDNMLAGATEEVAASADPPVIYASRAMGWTREKIARIQPPTEAERAACPPWVANAPVVGVWQTASGARRAWVVHAPSKDDPRGTYLFLR